MLEILAHANIGRIPGTHAYVIAEASEDVSIETHNAGSLPLGWELENSTAARAFGDQWLLEARSAILVAPAEVARLDANALVNPLHPDANKLMISPAERVIWDKRLFERG